MIRLFIILLSLFMLPLASAQQPISPWVGQRLMRIIDRADQDVERALDDMRSYATGRGINETDSGYIYRELAALLMREDRMEEALEVLLQALEGKPDEYVPSLRILLGQLYLMEGNSTDALPQLKMWAAHAADPQVVELALLGYAYLQEEQYVDAATTFEEILSIAEIVNDQWYEVLAYAYTQSDQQDKAIELLDRVIALQPGEERWWRQLGNIFLLMEEYGRGAASYAIANEVDGLNYENGKRLAGIFSMLSMPADGAEVLASLMDKYPDKVNFEDQMLLGELWMLARELDLAIAAFQTASTMTEDGEPALKISQLHLQWEHYAEARDALLMAIDAFGEETTEQVWYLLAIVELNLDNLDGASDAISRLDEDGSYGERAENLDQFIQNIRASTSL